MADNEFDHDSVQRAADDSVGENLDQATSAGRVQVLQQEYQRLMHAVQTGVAFVAERQAAQYDPKHLRVGVNSALISSGALAKVLIAKGVITKLEFWEALVETSREEVQSYEDILSTHYGSAITLS